jgi:hypothetical protein
MLDSDENKADFNTGWLQKNGYAAVYMWAKKNGGIYTIVDKCSKQLQETFQRKYVRTVDSAQKDLEKAFAEWRRQSQNTTKRKFNISWLQHNGFGGLCEWTRNNGGMVALVRRSSEEVQNNFIDKN